MYSKTSLFPSLLEGESLGTRPQQKPNGIVMVAFSPEDSLILQNLGFHISVIMVCHTESLHTPWKQSVIQGSLISQGIPIFLGKWGPCRVPIFLVIQGPRVSISWALCMWGPGISILEGPHPFSHDIVIRLPNFLVASYPPP